MSPAAMAHNHKNNANMSMNIFKFRRRYVSLFDERDAAEKQEVKVENTKYHFGHEGARLLDIPFEGARNEVIYTEKVYDEKTNKVIRDNLKQITDIFARRNLRFVYLPELGDNLSKNGPDLWKYLHPYGENYGVMNFEPLESNFLFNYMANPNNIDKMPDICLTRFNMLRPNYESDVEFKGLSNVVEFYSFDINELDDVESFFTALCDSCMVLKEWLPGLLCTVEWHYEDADDAFDDETQELLEDVEYKIDLLRRKGVSQVLLQRLIVPRPKLSRLIVTEDLRILLPDYQNMEIEMEPLVKAVYLLFLRHPEGILFKELPSYRAELAEIYGRIKGVKMSKSILGIPRYDKSITSVTDPLRNSINEKCARIKEAFLLKFQEALAENYFITGKRGNPKKIKLPEYLIEWKK